METVFHLLFFQRDVFVSEYRVKVTAEIVIKAFRKIIFKRAQDHAALISETLAIPESSVLKDGPGSEIVRGEHEKL